MFLEEILQFKYAEVATVKEQRPLTELKRELKDPLPTRPFQPSLIGDSLKLIAEIKKASPSKGLLCPNFDPASLARVYESSGAAAVSVLTDNRFFQGSLEYLRLVKAETKHLPALRKDFIIDRYQIYEARVNGADAILLIVAALKKSELASFIKEAEDLGLASLVEVHNLTELDIALESGADIIGINNRDLKTFRVDLETTFRLIEMIPEDKVVVSESGINSSRDIQRLAQAGVNAVLVGEALVTVADPGLKIKELLGNSNDTG